MINRKLIRIKAVQVAYAHNLSEARRPEDGENILLSSLGTAYDLYNTMLSLMVEISRLALRAHEAQATRAKRLGLSEPSRKFVDNRFMLQLESNRQLQENRKAQRLDWTNEEEFVRTLYNKVVESDFFRDYMESGVDSYEEDRELWRKVYRYVIVDNESIDDLLEDVNIYWNDDRFIIDTFVLKTINRFSPESNDDQPLLPEFRNEEDLEFARKLVFQALNGAEYYRSLIAQNTRNWDVERIAFMDNVILVTALAELINCPSIPVKVTLDEYIDLKARVETRMKIVDMTATGDDNILAEEKAELIAKDPRYGNVICRCNVVTEGEILYALRTNPKATDLDGVKRRTRAQMGRCQGGFCTPHIMELIAKENKINNTLHVPPPLSLTLPYESPIASSWIWLVRFFCTPPQMDGSRLCSRHYKFDLFFPA